MLTTMTAAPLAYADPAPPGPVTPAADVVPPPGGPNGPVPSGPAGTLKTPDGWTLTVSGSNESIEPVAPLTGSPASREYLVDAAFTGAFTGEGSTKLAGGTLEAGYQIGCGILADDIESISSAGIAPGLALGFIPSFSFNLSQQIKIV
ncbi:MAG TPA: MspA family porin, partial [Mycobacterium sp.]